MSSFDQSSSMHEMQSAWSSGRGPDCYDRVYKDFDVSLRDMRNALLEFHSRQLSALQQQEDLLQRLLESSSNSTVAERDCRGQRPLLWLKGTEEEEPVVQFCTAEASDNTEARTEVRSERSEEPSAVSVPHETHDVGNDCAEQCENTDQRGSAAWEHVNLPRELRAHRRMLDMSSLLDTDVDKPEYDVSIFYHKEGHAQAIARSEWFANLTLSLVVVNAVYIGVESQYNVANNLLTAETVYQVSEHFFCSYFLIEWVIRFLAFKHKRDCLRDEWFKFDTLLMVLLVAETWGLLVAVVIVGSGSEFSLGPLRLVRLLRLARMTRLLRALPELMTMIKGMRVASRAVCSSFLLLFIMVYLFSVAMYTMLGEEPLVEAYFGSVPMTMFTLTVDGCFMDNTGVLMRALLDLESYHTMFILGIFILLSAMTIMNMLVGVLCEVVAAVAQAEKENNALAMVKQSLLVMLRGAHDADWNDILTREELEQVIQAPQSLAVLKELKVDVLYLQELLSLALADPQFTLTTKASIEMIMACRVDRSTTLHDIINSNRILRSDMVADLNTFVEQIKKMIMPEVLGTQSSLLRGEAVLQSKKARF